MRELNTFEDIQLMVNSFYDKVNADDLLSPVFNDHAKIDWDTHLPKMYKFWDTLLFNNPGFEGSPFEKHKELPVNKEHFDRWLKLFSENMDELFEGKNAEEAKKRAHVIGITFWSKIAYSRGL